MPCAQLITVWYEKEKRGTFWGILSAGGSISTALTQSLCPFVCQNMLNSSWRKTMSIFSFFPILGSIFCFLTVKESPESIGLSLGENFKKLSENHKKKRQIPLSRRIESILLDYRPNLLGFSVFLIYILRSGIMNWLPLYFIKIRKLDAVAASSVLVFIEVGGFFGATSAGWISDRMFNGRRAPINIYFSLLSAITIILIYFTSNLLIINFLSFFFGLFLYGPQTVNLLTPLFIFIYNISYFFSFT